MQFESRFIVSGAPAVVIRHFADVPLMAGFLPGASVEAAREDGSHPATLVASFGPKKIAFKGSLTNRVDAEALAGELAGQASADVRGARIAVKMRYELTPEPGARTAVRLQSEAQLTGVLAEFARAGGTIVAEALIAEFARRFSAHVEAQSGRAAPLAAPREVSLSMTTVLAALLRRLRQWLWRTA